MLRHRQSVAVQGLDDVADADDEVSFRRNPGGPLHLCPHAHQCHQVARPGLGRNGVQAGEGQT